jgi:hypothetical protein
MLSQMSLLQIVREISENEYRTGREGPEDFSRSDIPSMSDEVTRLPKGEASKQFKSPSQQVGRGVRGIASKVPEPVEPLQSVSAQSFYGT